MTVYANQMLPRRGYSPTPSQAAQAVADLAIYVDPSLMPDYSGVASDDDGTDLLVAAGDAYNAIQTDLGKGDAIGDTSTATAQDVLDAVESMRAAVGSIVVP